MVSMKSDVTKTILILRLTSFFWIFAKLFSYNLWHTQRLFPLIPPFDFLENVPNFIHLSLFYFALAGIALVGFFPKNKILIGCTLVVELISCLLDQNRWQPWEYQYFLTFAFFFFYHKNLRQFVTYFSFLLIVIYFNSGLHKLNGGFLYKVWNEMILTRLFGFEAHQIDSPFIHYAGLSLGLIELFAALGCLFMVNKKFYALFLVCMHVFILFLVGPTGLNYNPIVWPWNIVMMMFILIVFYNAEERISFVKLTSGFNKIPFTILGILPFFCFLNLYDNFFSFNLYSGSLKHFLICVDEKQLGNEYKPYISKTKKRCGTNTAILGNNWALTEMNIVIYPEERFYKGIMKKWKEQHPSLESTFYIYQYPYKPENYVEYK
jgi:hypothetical protein